MIFLESLAFLGICIVIGILLNQCDHKKSPNVYKSCPKMVSLEKLKILTPVLKLPKNVGNIGKLIVAKGFKKLPKVQ